MGQFFAIGLTTEIYVKKSDVIKCKTDCSCVVDKMQGKLSYDPNIFENSEDEDHYIFLLKKDVFESQLIPFLSDFYTKIYQKPIMYEGIIEKLKSMPPEKWLEWAEEKPEDAFQLDEYGMRDTIEINYNCFSVYYVSLLLSMEGKISLEINERHFSFLKYCIMQTFSKYSLAGAIRIYITG